MSADLADNNINSCFGFCVGFGRFFNASSIKYKLFHSYNIVRVALFIRNNSINVIHCRSYHAAIEALKLKKIFGFNYKVVFDPRGLLPEESYLKLNSKEVYDFWKSKEQLILNNCQHVCCVSDEMAEHFGTLTSTAISVVYACFKSQYENLPDQKTNATNLCYVGTLSENSYHTPSSLSILFGAFQRYFGNAKLLIITNDEPSSIMKFFGLHLKGSVLIKSARDSQEVNELLRTEAHYGALPFKLNSNEISDLVADTMIGNKTIEYLFAGVVPIINDKCRGALNLAKSLNFGVGYSVVDGVAQLEPFGQFNNDYMEQLKGNFELSRVAKQYINLYLSIK